jgi:glycosyltransferase involved in cell wall biosynthesis
MSCVIFVANRGYALTSSRKSIINFFLSSGWKVVAITAKDVESQELQNMGVHLESVTFNRGGLIFRDILTFFKLIYIYRKWHPDLIHHFHAKPVIFGSIAARWVLGGATQVVNTITGLGNAFTSKGFSVKLAGWGYQFALYGNAVTIFQNNDDRNFFIKKKWVLKSKSRLIVSSGVDTNLFPFVNRHGRDSASLTVVMVGRLLKQKGVLEFGKVAHYIRQRYPKVRFLVIGEKELEHPDSITLDWIYSQQDVEFLGRLSDVSSVLSTADIFLFPSYYREGVPRAVLEASSMGLPIVGYSVPGVKEAVRNNETGYLVPTRNIEALTKCVLKLLRNDDLRLSMGKNGRDFMVQNFDKPIIDKQYIQVYREFGFKIE